MSEPINAQRTSQAVASQPPPVDAVLRTAPGVSLRVDGAHVGQHPVDSPPVSAAGDTLDIEDAAAEERLALQTAQIAARLDQQYADVDRREQRMHSQLAQLDQERRDTRMWAEELEAGLQDREYAITRQEAALAQRAESCLNLETELKQLHESLLRERHSLNAEREQFIVDRESDRRELEEVQLRQQHEQERSQQEFLAEQEHLRQQLQQERVLLDNRHRFQQEHLRRSMQEFEVLQAEFRREQQIGRTRLEEIESQNQLRARQLNRFRDLLDGRQGSIERERELLVHDRKGLQEQLRRDQEELQRERAQWEQERDVQRADLRRQHDMLALHAENLESRRQRLDRLRAEMEDTNRQTLEMRLAVEESHAQLMRTVGTEEATRRIEEARAVLAEYYRHTRDSLMQQRQELEQLHARQARQRDEFLQEREALVEWLAQQERQLAGRDQELSQRKQALDAQEQNWRDISTRWTEERLQFETVIRDLLRQLGEREAPAEFRST